MKHLILILTFSCMNTLLFGQTVIEQLSVYFKSNKYDLQAHQKMRMDTFLANLAAKNLNKIFIRGNTDSDADSLYNIKLSEKRVLSVKSYLLEKSVAPSLFYEEFNGENIPIASNNIEGGKQQNRRVDIIVFYENKQPLSKPSIELQTQKLVSSKAPIKPNTDTLIASKDTCSQDTTIILPQGTKYVISLCDYNKYKDSIKIVEFLTPESILNSNFSTMTTANEQLVTGGMFDVRLCEGCKLVRDLKFIVRVPIELDNPCNGNIRVKQMSLWQGSTGGRWANSQKIAIEKMKDTLYYTFRIRNTGAYNLDYKLNQPLTTIKTKIKVKGNIRLLSLRLFYQRSIYQQSDAKKGVVRLTLPICPSRGDCGGGECMFMKAVGINENNDTVVTSQCLNSYKKCLLFGKCKLRRKTYWLGFIPLRARVIYSTYFIRPKDWLIKQ